LLKCAPKRAHVKNPKIKNSILNFMQLICEKFKKLN
jgi:hypothetical protein